MTAWITHDDWLVDAQTKAFTVMYLTKQGNVGKMLVTCDSKLNVEIKAQTYGGLH